MSKLNETTEECVLCPLTHISRASSDLDQLMRCAPQRGP